MPSPCQISFLSLWFLPSVKYEVTGAIPVFLVETRCCVEFRWRMRLHADANQISACQSSVWTRRGGNLGKDASPCLTALPLLGIPESVQW